MSPAPHPAAMAGMAARANDCSMAIRFGGPPAWRLVPSRGRVGEVRARGFSLLEMLLVLALIAATTTLAAMAMSGGLDGMRLRSASKEIAAQLRYTRTQAIASGEPQRFAIDPAAHRWQAPNRRSGRIAPTLAVQFTGARQAQARAGEGGILFFPDGASTGGRIVLRARSAAWRIDVTWLTGEVRLVRSTEAGSR